MQCPRCGATVKKDYRFCPQCGLERMATDPATAAEAARSTPEETAAAPAAVRQSTDAAPAAVAAEVSSAGNGHSSPDTGRLAPPEAMSGAPVSGSDKDAVRTLLSQANLYRLRGLWAGAIDRCIAVLKIQPENPTAHSLLGDIYRDQDKIEDAIQWYRMAIQLRPNPSDEAKLKQMERERAREQRAAEARARAEAARTKTNTVSTSGTAAIGTAALLGISPRRWLRGMTMVSAAFILVVIIALIVLQMNHNRPVEHAPLDTFPTAQQAQPLPPAQHNTLAANNTATDTNDNSDNASQVKVISGGGMPPDHPESAAASTSTSTTKKTHSSANKQKSKESVSTASVLGVEPLSSEPGMPVSETAILPADSSGVQVKLPGGMQIAEVRYGSGSNINMTINVPNTFRKRLDEDSVRAQMIRTIYRASRNVFHVLNNMVTCMISFKTPGDTSELMKAEIDRNAALNNNPDTETALALQQRLIMVHFNSP